MRVNHGRLDVGVAEELLDRGSAVGSASGSDLRHGYGGRLERTEAVALAEQRLGAALRVRHTEDVSPMLRCLRCCAEPFGFDWSVIRPSALQ